MCTLPGFSKVELPQDEVGRRGDDAGDGVASPLEGERGERGCAAPPPEARVQGEEKGIGPA